MTSVVLVAAIVCSIFSLLLEEGTQIFPDNDNANLTVLLSNDVSYYYYLYK